MRNTIVGAVLVVVVALAPMAAAQNILVYDENSNHHAAQEALSNLSLPFTLTGEADFTSTLAGGTWDLVVMDMPSSEPNGAWQSALVAHINAGGAAIHTHWDSGSLDGLPAAFQLTAGGEHETIAFYSWIGAPLFTTPQAIPSTFDVFSDEWGTNGFYLEPAAGATANAGFTVSPTANQAAIVVGYGGRTIFNGFLFDDFYSADQNANSIPDIVELIMNEVSLALQNVSPQAIPALGGAGLLALMLLIAAAGAYLLARRFAG